MQKQKAIRGGQGNHLSLQSYLMSIRKLFFMTTTIYMELEVGVWASQNIAIVV